MGGLFLLRAEQVQKELKITDEQKTKLEQLGERLRKEAQERFSGMEGLSREERQKKFEEMREQLEKEGAQRAASLKKELAEILQPEQLKRFRQIELQRERTAALLRPEVAETVGLTGEQKEQLEKIRDEAQEKARSLWQEARGGDREQFGKIREKMQQLRDEGEKKAMAVLKPEQKQKLGEMMGEPFELDESQLFRRDGDRPRGEGGDRERRGGDRERRSEQ